MLEIPDGGDLHAIKRHDILQVAAWHGATDSMMDFLVRCARDFPGHGTLRTLSLPLDDATTNPFIIAQNVQTIGQMSFHLANAGEANLLLEHAQALQKLIQNNEHKVIRLIVALTVPVQHQALIKINQREAARALLDEIRSLADKHQDEADVQVPYAHALIHIAYDETSQGRLSEAQLFLNEAETIALRYPTHNYSEDLLRVAEESQKILVKLNQIQADKKDAP